MINGLDDGGSDLLVGEFGCLPVGYVFVIPEGYILFEYRYRVKLGTFNSTHD